MGGNLWRKWLGESDEPGRNRVQAFVYSRLWRGVSFVLGRIRCYIPYLLLGESACREVV